MAYKSLVRRKYAKTLLIGLEMLIDFSVQNFGPVLARQVFSMQADSSIQEDNREHHVVTHGELSILRAMAIYGANASGKSTLLSVLDKFQDLVLESAKYEPNSALHYRPFRLDTGAHNHPTEWEVRFLEDGSVFRYGVRFNSKQFLSEWLFEKALDKRKEKKLFERVWAGGKFDYTYGKNFEKIALRTAFEELTSPVNLFLSVGVLRNSAKLLRAFNWFKRTLQPLGTRRPGFGFSTRSILDEVTKLKMVDFLRCADLAIAGLDVEKEQFDMKHVPEDLPDELRNYITAELSGSERFKPIFLHKDRAENDVRFEAHEESSGTRELFRLAAPFIDILANNLTFIVDELDQSLHPLIVHQVLRRFHNEASKAQLIFSTHDASILSQRILRRDQICLVEKNRAQETRVKRLSDYSVRQGEAIEKGYLGGRYGGIPVLSDLE